MSFLNIVEIESALKGLARQYPAITELIPLPNVTHDGNWSHALRISNAAGFDCRPAFVFVSGVHAREWGGPDTLVNLAADLLAAYTSNQGLTYGAKTFSADAVQHIVERTDVVVFPDINPDGRAYSMAGAAGTTQAMWRKNRNPASSGGDPARIGVDVNRNYDFLWDFPVAFSPAANMNTLASTDPGNSLFHGTGPFSEPESRNVQWLVDRFPNARYFVDVHSYSGDVLYPWGSDENQATDPTMSFKNPAWAGKRGVPGDVYREYMPGTRLTELQAGAAVIRDGINAVRQQGYVIAQGFWLWASSYPTSGTSEDWAFTREFLNPARGQLNGFVIEFNKQATFFPSWADMEQMILDVDSGLLALVEWATPTRWQVMWCWIVHVIRDLLKKLWRRLFPWEIWGPFGPWSRLVKRVEAQVGRFRGRGGR